MMSDPVFKIFHTITSPAFRGGFTLILARWSMQSKSSFLGMARFVLTGSRACLLFSTMTVVVRTRKGVLYSAAAYSFPFLH